MNVVTLYTVWSFIYEIVFTDHMALPSQYLELSLKDVSTRFWDEINRLLYDKFDKIAISLPKNAGDKCHSYGFNEIEAFRSGPGDDCVQRLFLDWAGKKRATVADLGDFFHRSKDFGSQPFELLQRYCGE